MHEKRLEQEKNCDECGKVCDLEETVYKIRHEGRVHCFDSLECKNAFQMKEFGSILY